MPAPYKGSSAPQEAPVIDQQGVAAPPLPQQQREQEQEAPFTEKELELIRLDSAIAKEITDGAGTLVQYALNNLGKLVIDEKGRVVRQDAFQLLRALASRRVYRAANGQAFIPSPTEDEFFDVLEHLAATGRLGYRDLDDAINNLPRMLRMLIHAALDAAREAISAKPQMLAILAKGREDFMLKLMYENKETRKAYDVLLVRPHLLKFLSDYALLNLGVKLTQALPSPNRMAQARVLDMSTGSPRILVGGREERVISGAGPGAVSSRRRLP